MLLFNLATILFALISKSVTVEINLNPISSPLQVTAKTSRGDVIGLRYDYGNDRKKLFYGQGDVFLGIPYVKTPIGNLRFKKPERLSKFLSVPYNATFLRPACPQADVVDISEDCLHLNIYTPQANSTEKYPIMIWIHGGSLKQGSAQNYEIPSVIRNFVSQNIIVVTIQYRLGMLGYFTTFTEDFPPNRGALDQIEAIKFVKEEIANFGGNPNKITLVGQSAGAASIAGHLFSPLSQSLTLIEHSNYANLFLDLFQGAIMQSGSLLTCFDGSMGFQNLSSQRANQLCQFSTEKWNSHNYTSLASCLLKMPYSEWISLDGSLLRGWEMVKDGYFLHDIPRNLATTRPKIPVMYGNCKDEWSYFELLFMRRNITRLSSYSKVFFDMFFKTMASFFKTKSTEVKDILKALYKPDGIADYNNLGWLKTQSDIFTVLGFTGFLRQEIDWYLENDNKQVYAYEMTYGSQIRRHINVPGWTPIYHNCELPFLWMNPDDWIKAQNESLLTQNDTEIANFFADTWSNFVKTGKPHPNTAFWSPMNNRTFSYMDIGTSRMFKSGYREKDSAVWKTILPKIIGEWPPEKLDWKYD
uniref:Carboxylic ester hydrolase n=1 Tax=Panagrolaimus sp. ES5 TaxID=591445 RepID=A0AC34F7R6_9BILA